MNVIQNYLQQLNTLQELQAKLDTLEEGLEKQEVEQQFNRVLKTAARLANLAKYKGNVLKKSVPRNNGLPRWGAKVFQI